MTDSSPMLAPAAEFNAAETSRVTWIAYRQLQLVGHPGAMYQVQSQNPRKAESLQNAGKEALG